MKKPAYALGILLLAAFWITAAIAYPHMPAQVASHWDASGGVNGYMGKFWGTFLMPLIVTVLYPLLTFLPTIDPRRKNIQQFQPYYDYFLLFFIVFFYTLFGYTLSFNLGHRWDIAYFLAPAFAALFWGIGLLTQNAKPNYTIGIRTPWTLASDTVWEKTHALGGRLIKAAALISLVGMAVPRYGVLVIVAPVVLASLVSVVASYIYFAAEQKR